MPSHRNVVGVYVALFISAMSCSSRQQADDPPPHSESDLSDSEEHITESAEAQREPEGTGNFRVEPVLCGYGESGVQGNRTGQQAPDWVVLVVDVEAPEVVRDVEVASLELLDHATGETVSATSPVDMRTMSPNRSLDDLSTHDTAPFSGRLEPHTRLRLRIQANLAERQTPLRDGLPGRTSLCTPDGHCYGPETSGCCHIANWEACSLWPSAAPSSRGTQLQ